MYQEEPARTPCKEFMILATPRLISVGEIPMAQIYLWPSVVAAEKHFEKKQSKAKGYSKDTRILWELLDPVQDHWCK